MIASRVASSLKRQLEGMQHHLPVISSYFHHPFLFYFCPLKQNITITENADLVLAFWDGLSRGTKYVIDNCKKRNIPVEIHLLNK